MRIKNSAEREKNNVKRQKKKEIIRVFILFFRIF